MSDRMKAVLYYAPQDIRVEMAPIPSYGEDELRVKIDACAVCGTDLKSYNYGNPRIKAPLVMGHEFSGVVDKVGKLVRGFSPGERVVLPTVISCGKCYYCKRGWRNLCANPVFMGFDYPGGMAEYVTVPARALKGGHVIKVPGTVKAAHAALAEPLGCVINSIENCGIQKGDTVVVVGAGPMGIMNGCVAKEYGAVKVILSEISPTRLRKAEGFGFDLLVNPEERDLPKLVSEETGGIGADVVIVAAPAAKPQEEALQLVRKRGTVCLFASLPVGKSMLTIDSRKIHYGELRLVGTSDTTPRQMEEAVKLLSEGRIPADKLATHILKLDDIFKAFELMETGEALRAVLTP
ncbi:MAG: alcohol dehydrogenase catalytic domain-containing protein [Candidatus Bathyarchaeia archaeon]